jgi:diguanylate cyclase (GGDEF)-like protein
MPGTMRRSMSRKTARSLTILRAAVRSFSVRPSPGLRFEVAQRRRVRLVVRLLLACQVAYAILGIAFHGPGSMADDVGTSTALGLASLVLSALMLVLIGRARSPRRVEAVSLACALMAMTTASAAQFEGGASLAIPVYQAAAVVLMSVMLPWRVRTSLGLIAYTGVLAAAGILVTVHDPREAAALGGAMVFALAVSSGACVMTWNSRVDAWNASRRILVLNGALRAASLVDALTELGNRRALDLHLAGIATRRSGTIGFAIVDVDHFKGINDSYGHQVGDDILRMVARMIQAAVRAGDRAYRYGGEEFLVVFDEIEAGTVWRAGDRIRNAVAAPGMPNPEGFGGTLTVSIGTSEHLSGMERTFGECIADADRRLYLAKARGRNCVVSRDGADPDDGSRIELLSSRGVADLATRSAGGSMPTSPRRAQRRLSAPVGSEAARRP